MLNRLSLTFAYSAPLLNLTPALSTACCSVFVVKTPFIIGFSNSRLRFFNPLITDDDKYSSCLVSPFIMHPQARIISGLCLLKIIFIINGSSKAPGDSIKPILERFSPE